MKMSDEELNENIDLRMKELGLEEEMRREEESGMRMLSFFAVVSFVTLILGFTLLSSCSIPKSYYQEQLIAHEYHIALQEHYQDCPYCQYWRTQNFY